ncbi:hypothetical protein GCM10010440_75300 [Kitasatospora cinereorecta]
MTLPSDTTGYTVERQGDGSIHPVDALGARATLRIPAPAMWDGIIDAPAGEHLHRAAVAMELKGEGADAELVLTPDARFLADGATPRTATSPSESDLHLTRPHDPGQSAPRPALRPTAHWHAYPDDTATHATGSPRPPPAQPLATPPPLRRRPLRPALLRPRPVGPPVPRPQHPALARVENCRRRMTDEDGEPLHWKPSRSGGHDPSADAPACACPAVCPPQASPSAAPNATGATGRWSPPFDPAPGPPPPVPRRHQEPRTMTFPNDNAHRPTTPARRTRNPDHAVTQAPLAELGEPLVSSTLLLAGEEEPMTQGREITERLDHVSDAVVDSGDCGTEPTTVVDFSGGTVEIVSRGAGDPARFE